MAVLPLDVAAQIAQSSADPIFAVDAAGRITFWNAAMERLSGFLGVEVHGKPLRDVLPAFADSEDERQLRQALGGVPVRAGERFCMASSSPAARIYEAGYAPLQNGGGVTGAFAVLRDVTESRRAAEQRDESESRFRTMADGAPVLLWMSE